MKPEALVEAALFTAGRAVDLEELQRATGLGEKELESALEGLVNDYEKRGLALSIARIGKKWMMKVRDDYSNVARALAKTELPLELVKTAALIAYHQPIKQKDLHLMLGNKIYEHVKLLKQRDLISAKPSGRTFELSTTKTFMEYFGIEANGKEEMRKYLAEKVGLKVAGKEVAPQ